MRRSNILITTSVLDRRGAEKMILELASRLDRDRFQPLVLCLRPQTDMAEDFARAGVEVAVLGMRAYFEYRALRAFRRLIRDRRIDLVHTHLYRDAVYGRILGKRAGAAVVSTLHNSYVWRPRSQLWLDRATARWADRITAVSEAVRRFAVEREGMPADKVTVLHNGIETSRYRVPPGTREEVRKRMGVGPDELLVGSLGHLTRQKGFRYLVDAAPDVVREVPEARFLVFGEGELGGELEARVRDRGLGDRFRFPGFREDIPEVLSAFDLFVLPSLWEGLPVVLIEAMAAGLPIVATDVDGNLEVTGGRERGEGV
ncbi:MAG TPA: glycosyltransferase, partial [bacterium]|nr:glycosyltransferase [bacterium]